MGTLKWVVSICAALLLSSVALPSQPRGLPKPPQAPPVVDYNSAQVSVKPPQAPAVLELPATTRERVKAEKANKPQKCCACTDACTCGCNEGGFCTCGTSTGVSHAPVSYPQAVAPSYQPVYQQPAPAYYAPPQPVSFAQPSYQPSYGFGGYQGGTMASGNFGGGFSGRSFGGFSGGFGGGRGGSCGAGG
jgi:hypothetical protein